VDENANELGSKLMLPKLAGVQAKRIGEHPATFTIKRKQEDLKT